MSFLDHEGVIEYNYSKRDVFNAIIQAVRDLSGLEISSIDETGGRIFVKTGVSLRSWGENIPITVREITSGITQVSVISTPKTGILLGGMLDLGKNRENINRIFDKTSLILERTIKIPGPNISSNTTKLNNPLTIAKTIFEKSGAGVLNYCSECGKANINKSKYCSTCGASLQGT